MSTMQTENIRQEKKPPTRKEQKLRQKQEKKLDRNQKRQIKQEESNKRKSRRQERKQNKIPKRRLIPVWVKVLFVICLCIAGLIGGLMVGFGILGNGDPKEALEFDTWKHIIDIVKSEK